MVEFHLRCFGQVWKSPTEAPLRRVDKMECNLVAKYRESKKNYRWNK